MKKRQGAEFRLATRMRVIAATAIAMATIVSCATFPVRDSWRSTGELLPRGLTVELAPESGGESSFRIRGDELEGATISGLARQSGELWILDVRGMDWFSNWAEGWTKASFVMEGELSLRRDGSAWRIVVDAEPRIENAVSASMRLYGDYFEGEQALNLFQHRWDRIQAANEVLKARFPDAWFDYAEPRKIRFAWDLFARRVANFQQAVRAFLFPELYGYEKGRPLAEGRAFAKAESIRWDLAYTKERFPESLREIRDSGTMLRDFEECVGLWRLDFCWDALWEQRIGAAALSEK